MSRNNKNELIKFYLSKEFENKYHYKGIDLGVTIKNGWSIFKIWSPTASNITLNIYKEGSGDNLINTYEMSKGEHGVYSKVIQSDLNGYYYTYSVENFGNTYEIIDPYAKSAGVNGKRGLIVDFNKTNPKEWNNDNYIHLKQNTDAIIYEIHLRDFSSSDNSNIINKGKFLAFTELGTKNDFGDFTGISHLKELGITHVHLMPVYDFSSVDESINTDQYNWGYDPLNFNCLEGSYSTDASNGYRRIIEFKELIQCLHKENIGVIMDVVYNHTYTNEECNLNRLVPYYYHRITNSGNFSNGSGCGNEIATEKFMVKKMIIDSLTFFTKEFHIDGFRFDLMGLIDTECMNEISCNLKNINPNIILYGEPWKAGKSTLSDNISCIKPNIKNLLNNVAFFSDNMRDAIRGSITNKNVGGFISNEKEFSEQIKKGIVASTFHPQLNNLDFYAYNPNQCINYESCHDDETFFDRIYINNKDLSIEELININKMGICLILTSQGISFIHGGEEFLRTKRDNKNKIFHNTYNLPDKINQLNWNNKTTYKQLFNYYKGLILLRKTHCSFRMDSSESIQKHLKFIENNNNFVGYFISNYPLDTWHNIGVFFNPSNEPIKIKLPTNKWVVVVNNHTAGIDEIETINSDSLIINKKSHCVIVDYESFYKK